MSHAVVGGVPQFLSVSALERFDPRSGGCPRKWWYRYVAGLKEPDSASKSSGTALHAEIAAYLRTGVPALSSLAMSGLHLIPEPGPDLLVEQSIGGVAAPILTANRIPLVGFIDCAHDRGTNKGGEDVADTRDAPGTVEVIDWKWKRDGSRAEYYIHPLELVKSIQMSGYGEFVRRAFPHVTHVRLSHCYFPATRGRPRKVTRLHVVDDCARSWEYVEGLARSLRHVAAETSADRVDANTNACGAYGGCPYRGNPCTAGQQHTMAGLFGETAAKDLQVGLLQNLPPVLQQPAQLPQVTVDVRAQLAAEEAAQRAQQAAIQAPAGLSFADAWRAIEAAGRGTPALAGAAAVQRAALSGVALQSGAALAGTGELGALMIQDPAHVIQLGQELQVRVAPAPVGVITPSQVQSVAPPATVPAQPAFSILAPDAPASNPAMAAKPLEAPAPVAAVASATMGPLLAMPGVPPAAEPAKRRRKSSKVVGASAAAPSPTPATSQGAPAAEDLEVFIDCIPNGEFESLHPYVDALLDVLSDRYNPGGLRDVRCAPKDSPLGFGGWRGAVRAIVIEKPPVPGSYYLDTHGNEVTAEVADALRVVCERTGGLYVRGIR